MIGSLINFISNKKNIVNQKKNRFQPMPASFGLVPELLKNKDKDQGTKLIRKIYRSLEWL